MTLLEYFQKRTDDGSFVAATEFEGKKRVIFRGEVCYPEQILEYLIELPEGKSIRIESSLGSHPVFTVFGIDSEPQTFFGVRFLLEGLERFISLQKQG
ncbi:hypothetical protein FACS189419_04950 [Planctomycetales bacterium]|nr:hypothetical protein FACS189419_04950 [Planctomycetales bacterium]